MQVDVGERRCPVHNVQAEHHHPDDPEEQDVVAGDQHRRRVVAAQVRGVARPAERRDRPEARGEPGVEDVLVLVPALPRRRPLVRPDADHLAVGAVPDRDPVPPPELAADRPVVHVVDPVEVALLQLLRVDRRAAVAHGVAGRPGQRGDLDEPLQRQPRLDHRVAAAAMTHGVQVGALLGDDPALRAQLLAHGLASREPVHPVEAGAAAADDGALVEDRGHRQAVPAADLEVVGVVRRRHLHRARAERRVDVGVGDHRDRAPDDRQLDPAADEVRVALVVGVHGDAGVTQHRLHARGGDDDRVLALPVADADELALVLGVVHLDVRQRGATPGAPVDDALGPVDEAVVEHLLEHRLDGGREPLVEREALAAPVDAVTEAAHLAQDRPAGLGLPRPHPLDERLAPEVVARPALVLGEPSLDDVLRRDPGVIHTRQPQRVVALHAAAPGEDVDERVVHRVPEVQAAGDVGRRDDDAERRPPAPGIRLEVACVHPPLVQHGLYLARVPLGGKSPGGPVRARRERLGHVSESTSR